MSKNHKNPPPAAKQSAPIVMKPVVAPVVAKSVAAPMVAAPAVAAPLVVEKPLIVEKPVVAAGLAWVKPMADKLVGASSLAPLFDFSRQLVSQVEKQSTWWLEQGLAPSLEAARAAAQYRSEGFVAAQAMLKNVELLFRT